MRRQSPNTINHRIRNKKYYYCLFFPSIFYMFAHKLETLMAKKGIKSYRHIILMVIAVILLMVITNSVLMTMGIMILLVLANTLIVEYLKRRQ